MERNNFIKNILVSIENSIKNGVFTDVENHILELKDLSTGNEWT